MKMNNEILVDNFAGGGGASTGIEQALDGWPIDIAINHDPEALAMHAANHPETLHLCENIWQVDIKKVVAGRRVGLAWFSPDCKHFSKAKGGKPVEKKIRGLAWVVLKWAAIAKPRVICLENVEEFQKWGPLVDGKPCKRRQGMTFKRWKTQLINLGYDVDQRELVACDYGTPTKRKRLFIIARRDGKPIVWPEHTHAAEGNMFLKPYRTAAECIDWSIPCPSIFERKRPLADATLRRIARGIQRYVIDTAEPFIVQLAQTGGNGAYSSPIDKPLTTILGKNDHCLVTPFFARTAHADIGKNGSKRWGRGEHSVEEPLPTVTSSGDFAVISPILVGAGGPARAGQPRSLKKPFYTQTTKNNAYMVAAFLAQHNTGVVGHKAKKPLSTITSRGTQQNLVAAHIMKMRGTNIGHGADEPLHTISSGGTHHAEVRAFLLKYYGNEKEGHNLKKPLGTVTSKDRFALVTVQGEEYVIVDIGMRMLTPRELFNAQGFPADYIIDPEIKGKKLGKTAQVKMCGNSVCPPVARVIIESNFKRIMEENEKSAL